MASRHRARFSSIHIIRVATVKASDVRRPYISQIIVSFKEFVHIVWCQLH
jgi:ribosomal protein L20A (L18A)